MKVIIISLISACLLFSSIPAMADDGGFQLGGAVRSTFEIVEGIITYPAKLFVAGVVGFHNLIDKDNKLCYYDITGDPYPTALEAKSEDKK